MARARNIKPSIFKNELLGEADPLLTILFEGLWCLADREGRLEDRPKRIKAEIFPYREIPDINVYLSELERMDFILRYSVGGEQYIQVKNFVKHQSPHKTEKNSEIPAPPEKSYSCLLTDKHTLNTGTEHVKESLIPDSLIPDSLTQVIRSTGVDHFDAFFSKYPKKVKKKTALEIWRRKNLDSLADQILQDIPRRLSSDRRWKEGFIPDPTTYLNQERWNDELDTSPPAGGSGKPDWAKIPGDNEQLWPWAKQHGFSNPGSLNFFDYRRKLQSEVEARLNQ